MSRKPLDFIGTAHDDILKLPREVQRKIGFALAFAQDGATPVDAKPFTGNKALRAGAVMEIVRPYDTNTYRVAYTTKYNDAVTVLHVWMKKSSSGIATNQRDIDMIIQRLKVVAGGK